MLNKFKNKGVSQVEFLGICYSDRVYAATSLVQASAVTGTSNTVRKSE